MPDFVHLHCHTEYSLLDGAIRIKDLCRKAKDLGLPAAAITDHGNLFGALSFYEAAKEVGIKPIIGCEVYVAPGNRRDKDAKSASQAGYHLVLLAQNLTGYKNLIKLVSRGYIDGFHYKPRVDKEILSQWNEGLIALSACLKGEVPFKLAKLGHDVGLATAKEYSAIFPGRFYLELQANGMPEQDEVNEKLLALAKETGLPLVATNDCHYLSADDVEAHDALLCIQTNAKLDDVKRMRFSTRCLYYRPPEEMENAFAHCPEALANTMVIAEQCNLDLNLRERHFPIFEVPAGMTPEDELKNLARNGLDERLKVFGLNVDEQAYRQRLDSELKIICDKGFAGYFLIVQDFINWAKGKGIPVGPGRGSAAGSLVAYCLRITNLDPIQYKLLFERFLNAERASLPDIDVDFCYNRREEVIRYVTGKYGTDSVAQITTFGTMKAKAAIRDVGRVLGLSFGETDKIAKLVPDDLKMTLDKALHDEPELRILAESDPRLAKLVDISRRLEGLARHASTHAAGIVISDLPMEEYLPLYLGKNGEVVTQYDMKRVEKVGLIKFDFLGLKTLTVIDDTLRLIRNSGATPPDMDFLPLEDEATFALLCRAETDGVFQLESSGMRRVLTDLKPNCFEDVIALLALYRPGPLESGMVTDFVRRKHGEIPVEYLHPKLEPILKETYGVILYQEQVMRIASDLASYSLGEGDMLRNAMGKKDPAVMAQQRSKFLEGARANQIPDETAEVIFDLMEKFAGYGFNKSHSAAYALISYQTAYLKAHFSVEFMAALMTSEVGNADKIIAHVNACRQAGITILPPDVNKSQSWFSVEEGKVRFGLAGVKNVGTTAIESIVAERTKNGPYVSLLDFCQRVSLRKVTKRVLEHLIKGGGMDGFGCSRAALMAGMDRVVTTAQKTQSDRGKGQLSLMSLVSDTTCTLPGLGLSYGQEAIPEWAEDVRLAFEKEALGFFLSGNPLLPFESEITRRKLKTIQDCREYPPRTEVELAVLVTATKVITNKKGERQAFCEVADLTGTADVTFFPRSYQKVRELIESDQPLLLKGRISSFVNSFNAPEEGVKKLKIDGDEATVLAMTEGVEDSPVLIQLGQAALAEAGVLSLKNFLQKHPGNVPVRLQWDVDDSSCLIQLGPDFTVRPSTVFWRELEIWRKHADSLTSHAQGEQAGHG